MSDVSGWCGIHVVCGFSSVGKSEYIRHLLTTSERFSNATPVYEEMFRTGERNSLAAGDVFHLDISNDIRIDSSSYTVDVRNHPIASNDVLAENVTSVDFLVLPEGVLRERVRRRTSLSNDGTFGILGGSYSGEKKLKVLDSCPLVDRYSIWFDYFDDRQVRIRYIHSGNRRYREVANRQSAEEILANADASFESLDREDVSQ